MIDIRCFCLRLRPALPALIPLALAALLYLQLVMPWRDVLALDVSLDSVEAQSAQTVEEWFERRGYTWPVSGRVPRLALEQLPPDLDELEGDARKTVFLRALLPLVLAENKRLILARERLEAIFAHGPLQEADGDGRFVRRMIALYRVGGDVNDEATRKLLLRRVDEVPVALVLAQAANESAWGTSRFAQEGNALFGMWTWQQDSGLLPTRSGAGAGHRIRAYPDLRAAVRSYLYNINTSRAYVELRGERAAMRAKGKPLDALVIAGGLRRYSIRGDAYVEDIRTMIRVNDLHLLDQLRLDSL